MQYLSIILLATSVLADVNLYARRVDGSEKIPLGSISEEPTAYNPAAYSLELADYCIGTEDIQNHECFAYIKNGEGESDLKFIVNKTPDGIGRIQVKSNADAASPAVVVQLGGTRGPAPIMRPVHKTNKLKQQADKEQTDGKAQEGEQATVPGQSLGTLFTDPQAFVRQNWMIIVPALLLIFVSLGAEEDKPKAK